VAAICDTAKQLMDRAVQCAPRSADLLRQTREGFDPAPPTDERWAAICAATAKSFDDQLVGSSAGCRLTGVERLRNEAFLRAYYGRRTTPRSSGDQTVDTNLASLAAARDVLCACTDDECLRAAEKAVTAAVRPVPREMTDAMEDAVAISDEVSRCADRIQQQVARLRR
jgi:hypothetical protein